MQKLVIIGAGMASGRVLEHLRDTAPDAFDITVFNAEPRGNYNRIMLSPVLSGEKTYAEIITHDDTWYADNNVTCRFGEKVIAVDRDRRVVIGEKGEVPYDKLIFGTGSAPFIIPLPGHDKKGVVAYRDLEDTNAMVAAAAKPGARAVVIGGGLLGLEAAAGLRLRGMEVTVLHIATHLMERQLDEAAGYLLRRDLEKRGINVILQASTQEITGGDAAEAVHLADGTVLPCDIVVMAVGIRPAVQLARDCGLTCGRAIEVDAQMQTSDPDVYAVGECVEFNGNLFGLVAPLYDQAKVLAKTLLGQADAFKLRELSTKLKVTGCDLFSAGDFAGGDGREDIVFRDPGRGVYKRLVIEDDQLIGAVMYGDTGDANWFFGLIKDGTDISEMRDSLIFGPAFQGGAQADPMAAVAALPPEAEICGCNGVCKGAITAAIEGGATDLGAIRATTKASASCGTCTGLVEQVLSVTLGDDFVRPAAQPVCKCTDLTHEDVRRLIKSQELKSQPAVWQELGWKTPNGCHVCRPAINYYLLADWPLEYQDDLQSRFVNERNHANIQKDGTYSVMPRMWGGITTPDELRAIADAADKFKVPTVKVTGGQRIDLLGVKKEDLTDIWYDLNQAGMVSGHAYSKGLRTVKTCVGTDHCRFGTQDSTGLGIKLEKKLWGSWTPHKVKLGVSGCPRNCAEATCKDVGIICVDSGYQVSVAGAAGMDVKETERLHDARTEEEAIEWVAAFVQLYRENGKYLDRAYKWVAKVSLDWVKETLSDDATRAALNERFEISQSVYRKDPWADHNQTRAALYQPLADLTQEAAE
ncbi:NAD(P)/FAD-dependent oxidoreductase [Pseudooceanicola sediminis]|uniref:NAD(P)/FAD-dependent oxidoreductase n=1 Tax=Pseudooceanicola sediminis TaxID=2211117 RepID=A0A399J6S9_9RHOB|nr:nitrite reductase large subunit NirB [Pseudooceanicola sediminis]KAA2315538.1 NAD(P)/FAD-dependent oxidoreductase [Puniceibacterium sp. HSS470]RII40257.1 NAD(P)/FAD-dependent oxidoreductase [Pseudooceanicola sediminis]|tara:strand:+ start:51221 stop:53653 length:2433 start_codon:yes stop_codon:yes gene_type:complete